jgi:hypothetical protein
MGYENEVGAIQPLGFFDPLGNQILFLSFNLLFYLCTYFSSLLGLSSTIDQATFDEYRSSELKHGRVAQLAVLGYIIPEIFKFPGDIAPGISFASIPNGVAAIQAVPALGWLQMFFLIGAVDYRGFLILGDTEGKGKTAEELKTAKEQELSHGRLAMIAILELLRHDSQNLIGGLYQGDHLITGLPFLYQ